MIDLRRASRPLGVMAALALSAALTACIASTPVTPPDNTAVAPAGQGGESTPAPTGAATPAPAATNAPDATPTAAPTATPAPAAGGSGGGSSGGSGGSTGPVATFDVAGANMAVLVKHTGTESFIDTFIVQVSASELATAMPGSGGTYAVAGGKVNLGDTYKFDLSAPNAATPGSLNLGLPAAPFGVALNSLSGIEAEGRLVVSLLGNAGFGSSRIFTGDAPSTNIYFATRYNAQPSFDEPSAKAALAKGQTSELAFTLPRPAGHNFTVKVYTSAGATAIPAQPITAKWDDNVIEAN